MKRIDNKIELNKLKNLFELAIFEPFEIWIKDSIEELKSKAIQSDGEKMFREFKGQYIALNSLLTDIEIIKKMK